MADTVEFELVSPERLLLSEPVEMVVVPGAEGDFGVLPGHAPLISAVRPGVISTYEDGKVTGRIFVAGGFAEVTATRCTVLADEAVEIDAEARTRADERLRKAREALTAADTEEERRIVEAEIAIAEAFVSAIETATRA